MHRMREKSAAFAIIWITCSLMHWIVHCDLASPVACMLRVRAAARLAQAHRRRAITSVSRRLFETLAHGRPARIPKPSTWRAAPPVALERRGHCAHGHDCAHRDQRRARRPGPGRASTGTGQGQVRRTRSRRRHRIADTAVFACRASGGTAARLRRRHHQPARRTRRHGCAPERGLCGGRLARLRPCLASADRQVHPHHRHWRFAGRRPHRGRATARSVAPRTRQCTGHPVAAQPGAGRRGADAGIGAAPLAPGPRVAHAGTAPARAQPSDRPACRRCQRTAEPVIGLIRSVAGERRRTPR